MVREAGVDTFPTAFGNQTIYPALILRPRDSRLCVPASRQVCLYRVQSFNLKDQAVYRLITLAVSTKLTRVVNCFFVAEVGQNGNQGHCDPKLLL